MRPAFIVIALEANPCSLLEPSSTVSAGKPGYRSHRQKVGCDFPLADRDPFDPAAAPGAANADHQKAAATTAPPVQALGAAHEC